MHPQIMDKQIRHSERSLSRTSNVLNNAVTSFGCQIIMHLLAFVYRTIFIHYLNVEYLGLQGVFGNILQMLSLAEFGIGDAMTFSMYKPLYENNVVKVAALVNYYKKAYRVIAISVLVVGLVVLPFLNFFVEGTPNISEPLQVIYLLYVLNSVASYMFVHKQSLLRADQKEYIITLRTSTLPKLKIA